MTRIVVALLALVLASPVAAQQCPTLATVLAQLDEDKNPHIEIAPKDLLNVDLDGVRTIVFAVLNGAMVIGLEVNGCMTPPQPIGLVARQSSI